MTSVQRIGASDFVMDELNFVARQIRRLNIEDRRELAKSMRDLAIDIVSDIDELRPQRGIKR